MTETATPRTPFPERMHRQSVETHTRRAERALKELAYEVDVLGRRLGNGSADAEDARKAAQLVTDISAHFAALETLRETREWDEAEKSEPRTAYTHDADGAIVAVDARRNH